MEIPQIVDAYLRAYNDRDVDAMLACVSDDIVFENVSNSAPSLLIEGRTAFADLARGAAEAFISRRQSVRNCVIASGKVALEVDWEGTPRADMGKLRAGVQVSIRGASFFVIDGDRIGRITDLS